ncbi:MAG: hypothetical protein WC718_01770 [Phycisphaerales bacterium]|jgi:hypothetical protein
MSRGIPPRSIAPGSVPKAPPTGSPPRLNPQPKPIGPAKGGPPPFGTKAPKPTSPLAPLIRGEKQGGHGQAFHTNAKDATLGARILGKNPDGGKAPPMNAATKFLNKSDEKRAARILAKSPEMKAAVQQMAKEPPGAKPVAVTVPVPAGRTAPALKVVPRLPNGQPGPMSVQKATHVTGVVQKGLAPTHPKHVPGPAKVGYQTMYGRVQAPGTPPKK